MIRQLSRFDAQSRRASRRPGIFPGRRFAFAAGLAISLLAAWPGLAGADNSSQQVDVKIFPSSGATTTESITIGALETNCMTMYTGPQNVELLGNGTREPDQTVSANAWSLADVLGCLTTPVLLHDVTGVTVIQSTGAPEAELTPADLGTPSDFADAAEEPLIFSDGTNIIYDRPWRGGSDSNASDQVTESDPSPFTFEVFEGPVLTVTATASPTSIPAGGTVTFAAAVKNQSGTLSYSWNFDGGANNSTQIAPRVTFPDAGTYNVTVEVTDTAGGGGVGTVPIPVTSAKPTKTPSGHHSNGPIGSNGKTPGASKGSSHSSTSGKPSGSRGDTSGTGKPSGHTTTSPASPSTSGSSKAPATIHHTTAAQTRHRPAPSTRARTSSLISGRLISDVVPIPAAESPLVRPVPAAAAGAAPALRRLVGGSPLPAFAAGLAVIVLFAVGAARELRWARAWRVSRPGD